MANTINFSGLGSGIDFNTIRDAILAQRSRPITQLQSKANAFSGRIEALKKLNGLLAGVATAAQALTDRAVGTGRSATVANSTVASATATSAVGLGSIRLDVTRLATNFTQASRSYASSGSPILVGGASSAIFELRTGGAGSGVQVTIDSTTNTLAGLRDAINAQDAGVTASIIDLNGDGSQQQLVLTSGETGAGGRVELIETSSTGTGADLNLRSLNPPDGDFSSLDSLFAINGLNLTRSSNNVSDAISGLSLTLKAAGSTSIEISRADEIEEKLTAFVTAYNAVQDFVSEQYKKDGQGRPTGILAGDSALRTAQRQLSSITGIQSDNNGGPLRSLTEIGLAADKNGRLSLDAAKLDEQLAAGYENVRALLYGNTDSDSGIFQSVHSISRDLSDDITGTVQTAINGYQTSVKTISDQIERQTELLDLLRESLTRRFAAADAAISQLNGQGSSLQNVIKSLQRDND